MKRNYKPNRRGREPLTEHEILTMRVMVQEGIPQRIVAIRFDVDVSTVSRHAPVTMGRLDVSDELKRAMIIRRSKGDTYRAIAARFKVALGTAHAVCGSVPLPKAYARAGQPRKFVPDDVKALESKGMTSAEIGARLGMAATSVRTMMWRYRKMERANANGA